MDMIDLEKLIAATRDIVMTPEQAEEQRRSFAYGNCRIETERVTREMVDEVADERLIRRKGGITWI